MFEITKLRKAKINGEKYPCTKKQEKKPPMATNI